MPGKVRTAGGLSVIGVPAAASGQTLYYCPNIYGVAQIFLWWGLGPTHRTGVRSGAESLQATDKGQISLC